MTERALTADERAALRRFSRRSDARGLLAIAGDWGLIFLAAALSEVTGSAAIYLLAVIVISRQMNALFELHHHAIHCNLFSGKRWNRILQFLYSLPLWTTVDADRDDHMEHHRTFNTVEKDYLTWGTGYGLDPAKRLNRRYMIWFLWIRPFLGFLQAADLKELLTSKRWRDPAYGNPVALFCICAVAFLLAAGRIDLLLWYWLVPRFTIFPVLFFWDDMLGHYNCPRTGTREMRGLWFRIFSAHGTDFHNVHHLHPAIPWFNMEKATALVIDESEVDVARGFLDGMRQLVVAQE
ncbi:MAG TPA: fatty acid desaturase [Thermoanaerobaculia bacterium]|jgi:fatty acid desaturase|nr:fatty acid desaturase [Thermoanaerobaculia bacterium]